MGDPLFLEKAIFMLFDNKLLRRIVLHSCIVQYSRFLRINILVFLPFLINLVYVQKVTIIKKNNGYFDYLFSLLSLLKYEPSLQM